jgi:D-glycero-D-manno-heptose 1,7-bisphosphate phosphatase
MNLPPSGISPAAFPLDGEGVWSEVLRPPSGSAPRSALFLDRDGVVVEEVNYLSRPEDVRLIPGAVETIAAANRLGVPVILITNQSGIGRGYYGWDAFAAVQRTILDRLGRAEAFVDAVYACPYHADGIAPYRYPDHPARKPNPGMMLRASVALRLDLGSSWVVGDRAGDLEAARRARLAGGVHVLSGHGSDPGERAAALALAASGFKVATAPTIAEAMALIPLVTG